AKRRMRRPTRFTRYCCRNRSGYSIFGFGVRRYLTQVCLASARVSRAGFGVSPKQSFVTFATPKALAVANTREAGYAAQIIVNGCLWVIINAAFISNRRRHRRDEA